MNRLSRVFGRTSCPRAQKAANEVKDTSVEEPFERCILCGKLTPVPVSTPVGLREFYEEGCGQLCVDCHKKVYMAVDQEVVLSNEQITTVIERSRKQT